MDDATARQWLGDAVELVSLRKLRVALEADVARLRAALAVRHEALRKLVDAYKAFHFSTTGGFAAGYAPHDAELKAAESALSSDGTGLVAVPREQWEAISRLLRDACCFGFEGYDDKGYPIWLLSTSALRGASVADCNACLAALSAGAAQEPSGKERPKIVCLCGSTRFTDEMLVKQWELTKAGIIVLTWCALPESYMTEHHGDTDDPHHIGDQEGVKKAIDELHKRKIDLADEVFVINVGGYIGDSTRSEIKYAERVGKPVKYLEAGAAQEPEEGEAK